MRYHVEELKGKAAREKQMTHTERWWSKRYIGSVKVELANGKKLTVSIHKQGRSFWVSRVLVHPSNSGSIEGAIREIGVLHDSVVKEWEWLPIS